MQRRPVSALAVALATAIAIPLGFAPPAQAAEPSVRPIALTKGHIDLFEVTYDAGLGGLRMGIKDDTRQYDEGVVHRDPTTVTTYLDSELTATDVSGIDGSSPLSFLTVGGAVSTVYMLPQTQDQRLPWPGWSTERLVGTLPDGVELPATGSPVRLGIEVDGPGEVFAWQTGTFGGVGASYVDTVDPAADEIPIARSAHVHTNWAFTAFGDYTLTVTPSATTTAGDTLAGPGVVYRIHVGPATDAAPQTTTAPSIAGTGIVSEALTLSLGEWLPNPHTTTVQWLLDGEPISGAMGTSYTPATAEIGKTITARVTAKVGDASTEVITSGVEISAGEPPVELLPTSFQTFTATPASPRIGQNITLSATVNPRGGTAAAPLGVGGIVEFYRGSGGDAVKLGQGTITSLTLSRATFAVPATQLGANEFSARYLPPSTHAPSTSAPATVTVAPATTNVATAASLSEAAVGQPVVVAAAVSPAAAPGQVKILDGDTVIAEGPVVQGRFQATVHHLPAGAYSLRATFTSAVPEYADSASLATLDVPLAVVKGAPRGTWARTVVDHEHVDVFSVTLDGNTLKLGTRIDLDGSSKTSLPKYGSNRERIEPAQALFLLPDKVSTGLGQPGGRKTVPDNANYAFLGNPGDTVWIAPASSDGTPFLYAGVETESIANGQLKDNRIDIHLVDVDVPEGGRFEAYTGALTANATPWRLFSSADSEYSSAPFGVSTHDHFSWAFTTLGTYVLHVKATATLPDGTPVETEVRSFTWVIGDLAGAPDIAVAEEAGTEGASVLTATVAPAASGHVEFRDADGGLLGFTAVADGVAHLPVPLAAGSHQVAARFLPAALDEYLPADSGVVTVQVAPAVPEPTPTPTATPTSTPTPTASPTPTVPPTPTPTPTVSPTPTPAPTKKLTATPVPKISGTVKVGRMLKAKPGTWKPSGVKLAYQWYRGSTAITGATKSSYLVRPADKGAKLTVKVTGSKSGYVSVAKKSKATKKVAAGTLTTAKPKISGTVKVGRTLTAKPGTWKPAGLALTYQWYRSGKKIGGANQKNYVLTAKDKLKKITVKVTGKAAGYATRTTTSKATRKVR